MVQSTNTLSSGIEITHAQGFDTLSSTAEQGSLPFLAEERLSGFIAGVLAGVSEYGNLGIHVRCGFTIDAEMVAYLFRYKVDMQRAELGDLEASRECMQRLAHALLERGYRRVLLSYAIFDIYGTRVLAATESQGRLSEKNDSEQRRA